MTLIHRALVLAVGAATLAGCETLTEPSIMSSEILLQTESGAFIRSDLTQSMMGESAYRLRAVNLSNEPVCAKATLNSTYASNYSLGTTYLVPSGSTVEIGFMDDGGSVETHLWSPNASGACGYPPA